MVKVLCYGHKDTSSTLVRVYPPPMAIIIMR